MLIEFSVTNYRSILERQTLNLAASTYFKELEPLNTFTTGLEEGAPRLLRSTVLYGPNASGKSTLIQALRFTREHVINSQKESQAGDAIDVVPFKLTAKSREADSAFEITFVEYGVRYEYGFCCNTERFTEEWLIAYPLGRAQKWFHRVFDIDTAKDVYKFSATFLGGRQRQTWASQTRPNALFFSTAIQLNNEQLKPAFDWFKLRLRVIDLAQNLGAGYTVSRCSQPEDKKKILAFMNSADLSIADIELKTEVFNPELLPKKLPAGMKDEFSRKMAGKELTTVKFLHSNVDGSGSVEFEENEESDGTRALFAFAGPWLDLIENARVLVVD